MYDTNKNNSHIIGEVFWIRTPTALIMKDKITPDEYDMVVKIECEYEDGSKGIKEIEYEIST